MPLILLALEKLGCDIGGAKELGMIYFPTDWGAKEPQNPQNHRVENDVTCFLFWIPSQKTYVKTLGKRKIIYIYETCIFALDFVSAGSAHR